MGDVVSERRNMRKVALTSLAGTSIEWYDFFLYGTAAAVVFPKAFFPQDLPPMVLLIISFSTFAVGLLPARWAASHFDAGAGSDGLLVTGLMVMGSAAAGRTAAHLRHGGGCRAPAVGTVAIRTDLAASGVSVLPVTEVPWPIKRLVQRLRRTGGPDRGHPRQSFMVSA